MPTIADIRKQHPGAYDDLTDQQLADKLHAKFYADMPVDTFYAKVGFRAPAAPAAQPAQAKKPGLLDGAPTKPLAQGGAMPYLDQLYRTFAGGAGDLADAATGLINNPLNAVLRATGVDYQFPTNTVGKAVPQPVGLVPQLTRGAIPYAVGEQAIVKGAAKAPSLIADAFKAKPIVGGIMAGAAVDAGVSGTQDQNLSNLINDLTGANLPTARVQGESAGVAALKDMAEGGVLGGAIETVAKFFTRGGRTLAQPGTPEAAAEEAAVEQAVADPAIRAQLEASGITPESTPRYQEFVARAEARRAAEAARAADPYGMVEPQTFRPAARPDGAPPPSEFANAGARVDQTIDYREKLRQDAADLQARTQLPPDDPNYIDPAALPTAGRAAPAPEQPLRVTQDGQAFDPTEGAQRGQDLRKPSNLPVPVERPTPRMSDAEIVRARASMDGGNTNPIPARDAMSAPEGRLPQTRADVAGQRDAEGAFTLADRQAERVAPGVRDTQTAGLPEGPKAERVLMDDNFPVRVVESHGNGRVTVQRYDPRTGELDADAVPYETRMAALSQREYTPEPRRAQDFGARDNPERMSPENPRTANEGVTREPTQTYRATENQVPDDGGPAFPNQKPGPMPGPDQPRGERARRAANEEELRQRYERARQDQQYSDFSQRAREGYKGREEPSSNTAGAPDADGRYATDDFGFVKSDKGGPIRFSDQKQAAKWVINVGHKTSPDQIFEIANGPKGGFTVRETGRSAGPGGGAPGGGAARAEGNSAEPPPGRAAAEADAGVREGEPPAQIADNATTTRNVQQEDVAPETTPRSEQAPAAKPEKAAASATDEVVAQVRSAPSTDPGVKAELAKLDDGTKGGPRMYSGLDPDLVKEELLKPAGRFLKKQLMDTVADARQVRADLAAQLSNFTPNGIVKAWQALRRLGAATWVANADTAHGVAKRYPNIPEAREFASLFGTNPGSGQKIGETFERAFEGRVLAIANRLQEVFGKVSNEAFETKVGDILAGRKRAVSTSPEGRAAAQLRDMLNKHLDYLRKAGVEVGFQRDYFPRWLDEDKVLANADAFTAKLSEGYRRWFDMSKADADAAAKAVLDRIAGVTDTSFALGSTASKHTKGRTLPPEADALLKDFYLTNPRDVLTRYFQQTSRLAEFTRRFGKNGEKALEMLNAMTRKGMSREDRWLMESTYMSSTGQLSGTRAGPIEGAASVIHAAGTIALLPRAVIQSLAEQLGIALRSHAPVKTSLRLLADTFKDIAGVGDHEAKEVGEALGILGDAMTDLVINSRMGGDNISVFQGKTMARFFRTTGLHQLTEYQRMTAVRVGQRMILNLLEDVHTPGSKVVASSKRILNELGIGDSEAKAIDAWIKANGGEVPVGKLWDDGEAPEAYRTALRRFVDESIQNPTAADRPIYANRPLVKMAYGITSFTFSFTRNVLFRTGREVGEAAFGKGYTLEDRMRLASPLLGLALLSAGQSIVSDTRDRVLNPDKYATRTEGEAGLTNLSRSGIFGTLDPFVNYGLSLKYKRDPSTLLTGPHLAFYAQKLVDMAAVVTPGLNSPNTNNAENNAAKAAYQAILAPAAATALSWMPGGSALRVAYGVGLQAATAPGTAQDFADKVAGEKTVKPKTGNKSVESSGLSLSTSSDTSDKKDGLGALSLN